ncbi:DUF4401 domain-containing protein [Massilia sp. B-10]|nr:DUF4401 domain-containing protein [Massilia sp. B-10]
MWSALALPLCLGVRHDALWAPWALVVMTAVTLWVHAKIGYSWDSRPGHTAVHLVSWLVSSLLVVAMSPVLHRYTGAGPWAMRTALVFAAMLIAFIGLDYLFDRDGSDLLYFIALATLGGAMAAFCSPRLHDIFALSAIGLSLNVMLVGLLVNLLLDGPGSDRVPELTLIAIAAAAMLAKHRPLHSETVAARYCRRDSMSHARLDQLISTAIAEGILPPGSTRLQEEERPWPVIALTALGAWLAAIPLISIFFIAFGGVLERGAGPFLVGIPLLAAAVALLRKRNLPLFVEQLLVPALIAALVILGSGLFDKLSHHSAIALLCALAIAIAVGVDLQVAAHTARHHGVHDGHAGTGAEASL